MKDITRFKKMELGFNMWGTNHYTLRTIAGVAFISYNTIVAFKAKDTYMTTVSKDWNSSRITTKNVCEWVGASGVAELRKMLKDGTILYDENL